MSGAQRGQRPEREKKLPEKRGEKLEGGTGLRKSPGRVGTGGAVPVTGTSGEWASGITRSTSAAAAGEKVNSMGGGGGARNAAAVGTGALKNDALQNPSLNRKPD